MQMLLEERPQSPCFDDACAKEQPFKPIRGKIVHVPADLRRQVLLKVAHYSRLANQLYGINFDMPTCSFDLRGCTAGRAYYREHHVQFNPVLLNENPRTMLAEVAGHEVAHLVAFQLHKKGEAMRRRSLTPHGPEWQKVMRDFGLEPRRTHSFRIDNATVSTRLFAYRCECPGKVFKFGPRKHANAQRTKYFCRRCLARLSFDRRIK